MPAFPSLQDALSAHDIVKIPSSRNSSSTWARRQFSVSANPQSTSSPNSNFPDLINPLSTTSQASLLPSSTITPPPPPQSPSSSSFRPSTSSSSSTTRTFSPNFGTATSFPSYTKPISTSTPGTASGSATSANKSPDAKAIVFGVIGGALGLLILIAILLRHHRNKARRREMHDTFWEKWHWGTYSPLHGDVVFVNQDLTTTDDVSGNGEQNKKPTTSWWQKFKFSRSGADGNEKVGKRARKQRSEKVYKVKRLKPSDKFEIDSEADSSVVDLTAYTR